MSIITSEKEEFASSSPLLANDSIFVDKFKMDQVIRNLISNALKFTPKLLGATSLTLSMFGTKDACSVNLSPGQCFYVCCSS